MWGWSTVSGREGGCESYGGVVGGIARFGFGEEEGKLSKMEGGEESKSAAKTQLFNRDQERITSRGPDLTDRCAAAAARQAGGRQGKKEWGCGHRKSSRPVVSRALYRPSVRSALPCLPARTPAAAATDPTDPVPNPPRDLRERERERVALRIGARARFTRSSVLLLPSVPCTVVYTPGPRTTTKSHILPIIMSASSRGAALLRSMDHFFFFFFLYHQLVANWCFPMHGFRSQNFKLKDTLTNPSQSVLLLFLPGQQRSICLQCRTQTRVLAPAAAAAFSAPRRFYSAEASAAATATATTTTTTTTLPPPHPPVTTSTGTHAATSTSSQIYRVKSGVILTRPPLLTRDLTPFEESFYFYQKRLNERLTAPFRKDFYFKKDTAADLDWRIKLKERHGVPAKDIGRYNPRGRMAWNDEVLVGSQTSSRKHMVEKLLADAEMRVSEDGEEIPAEDRVPVEKPMPRRTEADEKGDVKRLDRALDKTLYLVVKKKAEKEGEEAKWMFPTGVVPTDEGLHEVRYPPKPLTIFSLPQPQSTNLLMTNKNRPQPASSPSPQAST